MSLAVSAAKAKPAMLGAGAVVDGGDIGTAVGVVPVFLWLPELEEPLSHTHYELHETYLPVLHPFSSDFAKISVSTRLEANVDFFVPFL